MFSISELPFSMFVPAVATPPLNLGVNNICNRAHESFHDKGIRGETMGKCHPSGHQDEWSESVDFSADFLPEGSEMEEEDNEGQVFFCACNWKCSV